MTFKALRFWPVLLAVVFADCASKRAIEARLAPAPGPQPVAGDFVRFRLSYNQDAAFGIPAGGNGRWVLAAIAALGVVAMVIAYRFTDPRRTILITSFALIAGGALGNMIDRLRSTRGVVDFVDVGIGNLRFYTFNVADVAITCGAVLLFYTLMLKERKAGDA